MRMRTPGLLVRENRLALIHRVLVPNRDYPREYAILVTDQRSIFILQPKTRGSWVLRQEMRFGTSLVTDVSPMVLGDYKDVNLETLANENGNITIRHDRVISLTMNVDPPDHRRRDFFVYWVMKRQKEIFQVYNFQLKHWQGNGEDRVLMFYAVPLGAYFKPKRQTQTRETILREYATDLLDMYRTVLPTSILSSATQLGTVHNRSEHIARVKRLS